jgi:hypothetical protein
VETGGGNQEQLGATRVYGNTSECLQVAASSLHQLRQRPHKEGVDGSSPSEGSGKPAGNGGFSRSRSRTEGAFGSLLEADWKRER